MPRLNVIAKGNGDVRAVLHALHEGGAVAWNGLNAALHPRHPGWTARVRHETFTRSDALLAATGATPQSLAARALPLGPFPAEAQFETRLFAEPFDVAVLSIQPDVMNPLVRSQADGHLFYPYGDRAWPEADRLWLAETYRPEPPLDAPQAMAHLARLVERIQAAGTRHVLVFNLSPVIPWERIHCYQGLGETLSQRIRRFNLALTDLSAAAGVSIVDVESVLARAGAERLKVDAVTLTAEGCRLVCEEVVRILEDLGCIADAPVEAGA